MSEEKTEAKAEAKPEAKADGKQAAAPAAAKARKKVKRQVSDGIAFIHEHFRIGSEPRVENWWLQDGDFDGSAPEGRRLAKDRIRKLLKDCTVAGTVDEDEFYRRAGLVDFTRPDHKAAAWRMAHGTHVMDTATGYVWSENQTNRPIVAVQSARRRPATGLPTSRTTVPSGAVQARPSTSPTRPTLISWRLPTTSWLEVCSSVRRAAGAALGFQPATRAASGASGVSAVRRTAAAG